MKQLERDFLQGHMTRGDGSKMKEGRLDIRRKFFTMRVMKQRHRLCREVVDAPSLEVFMAGLDEA